MDRSQPLPARSLAECYLFLMVTPCPQCGEGGLAGDDARTSNDGLRLFADLAARCSECHRETRLRFELPPAAIHSISSDRISRDASPSRLIDVVQWVTLFRMITAAADRQIDKAESRRLGYEAAQCLDEALKFYEQENDLPPDSAFFHERSRTACREHPDRYSRDRLINLRAKLPSVEAMERTLAKGNKPRRKWWPF